MVYGMMNEEVLVLWGAGKIGRQILNILSFHGMAPNYICDINTEKQGTTLRGVDIISPNELSDLQNIVLIAGLQKSDEVLRYVKLRNLNIQRFIDGSKYSFFEVLLYIYETKKDELEKVCDSIDRDVHMHKCIMDFTYGTLLGGVQTWCYSQCRCLDEVGVKSFFLMSDLQESQCDYPDRVKLAIHNDVSQYDYCIDSLMEYILSSDAGIFLINFPREIMIAAILVKILFKPDIRIVAVIHNDDEIYYDTYNHFKDYISKWLVVSDVIEKKILERGISPQIIYRINWKIPTINVNKKFDRLYIGYAGRIVHEQKRIDLILDVAEKLKDTKMDFLMEIAGSGESEEYLVSELSNRNLSSIVSYIGCVPHEKIMDFWEKKNVFLSCSDYEGHSISQYEAMAAGAVPVVTNTSGVEDDLVDGENGYILPIGDVDGIVEKIIFLSQNIQKHKEMSEACIRHVEQNNARTDEVTVWKQVLDFN